MVSDASSYMFKVLVEFMLRRKNRETLAHML